MRVKAYINSNDPLEWVRVRAGTNPHGKVEIEIGDIQFFVLPETARKLFSDLKESFEPTEETACVTKDGTATTPEPSN